MRILADENVPRAVVEALRDRGHDVRWIADELASTEDRVVLALAQEEARLLITFDTDFGALAIGDRLPSGFGIMLFRLQAPSPAILAIRILATLESRDDWAGHFTVVEPGRTRMRRLPPVGGQGRDLGTA